MKFTEKKEVTEAEYLQLVGLLVLAKRHNDKLIDIRDAVMHITGETDDCGHSSDAVYSDYSADELLKKLEIAVSANAWHKPRGEAESD